MDKPQDRLDASESIFFKRELEAIDQRTYGIKFPMLKGRSLLPKVGGIGENDRSYTYRMYETFGKARIVADGTRDLPKVNVTGQEYTSQIKDLALSYDFGLFEVRAAAAAGRPLEDLKAMAARRGIEELIDTLIAFGDSANNMVGFANNAAVDATLTPSTKAAGGTTWLASGQPNATAREMVADVNRLVDDLWSDLKEADGLPSDRVSVVLSSAEYAHLSSAPMGDNADKTALRYLLENNDRLAEIVPWHKLAGAGDSGKNRAIAFIKDPMVCGALIAMEYSPQPAQQTGLAFEVPVVARCGGAVIRYPVAVKYEDGF